MANALGRISGQLLKDNLERDGKPLQFDNGLLFLNTSNGYVGINNDTPFRDLFVTGTTKTENLISVNGLIGVSSLGISISDNNIVSNNDINLFASNYIFANDVRTDHLILSSNDISTHTLNTNLEFRPNGTGSLEIYNDVNVLNSKKLYSQGDITLSGNLIIGNSPTDTVTLQSNVNSDIAPSENNLFSLGSNPATIDGSRWLGIYPTLINGQEISVTSIGAGGINLVLRPGNSWYVSTIGSNTNEGDHQSAAFATIQYALSQAAPGDEIFIYPGTYTEVTPLVIPVGVTLKGISLRSVKIVPDATTQNENVILLNGETTVSNITIADFYYNSVNDTGYAFSFAPGFKVTSRSPYIQDVSVITKGSVTTVDDPRGFASGDAGKGALVDGAQADTTSKEATMLFHSCTFITPGVDALTMTNGVRVEWLNSFSYFANIGLYATAGVGRYDATNSITRYGAELRSISSANVYGNYGAWAEGQDTLMYLINHNFAYIGSGKDSLNDPSLQIQDNEVTMLDTGEIHYESVDNKGNFKVGDPFTVSFETGTASINGVGISAAGISSILFGSLTSDTIVNSTLVSTGNIKFNDNTISSLISVINLAAHTNEINLNSNVDITSNLEITNNFNIDGTLTIGNEFIDTVRFEAPVEFNLRPVSDNDFTLGGPTNKSWDFVYLDTAYIGSYKLENATISTLPANADIELQANNTGKIYIPANNVEMTDGLTVNGTTTLGSSAVSVAANITGEITHIGNYYQTGNTTQTGNREVTGTLDVTNNIYFDNINIVDNRIFTTNLNDNLELRAIGTGIVVFNDATQFSQNVLIGTLETNGLSNSGTVASDIFTNNDITINDNYITTTVGNNNLILSASGTGGPVLEKLKFDAATLSTQSNNDNITLSVPSASLLIDAVTALKVPVGTTINRPTLTRGEFRFNTTEQLYRGFDTTTITFGGVYSANRLTNVLAHPSNNTLLFTTNNAVAMTLSSTGITVPRLSIDNNLTFSTNTISSTSINDNIFLTPNGTGSLVIDNWSFEANEIVNNNSTTPLIFQNTGAGYVAFTGTSGLVIPTGDTASQPVNPELGDLRYNTELEVGEIFDGISYRSIAGNLGDLISEQESQDISAIINIIFG